ncbi:MAG: hypothetical protein IPO43_14345 [Rhodoferax sp.]|nr:hypothetical protein [Rhodoferax sp.]
MKSIRHNPKIRSANAKFLQLAAGLTLLVSLLAIWLVRDHTVLLDDLHQLQTETLSNAIARQRMARNLDELRLHGERVLFASTQDERRQALLVVQVVVNRPAFVSDPRISAVASDTERF